MSPVLKQFKARILKLSPKERAVLATHLIASLDDLDETNYEKLWIKEADKRYKAYKAGKIIARPADDVLASISRKLT